MDRAIFSALILLIAVSTAGAVEAEKPALAVISNIDAVTVYPDQAQVARQAKVRLDPGKVSVLFQNLPDNLLEDSVRVSGSGSATATITDIRIGRGSAADEASARLFALKKAVDDLDAQIQSRDDRLDILGKKGDFISMAMNIKSPSRSGAEAIQKKGILEWPRLLAYLDEQLSRIAVEKRGIEKEKKGLMEKKQASEYELSQFASLQKRERRTVQVDLQVARAGEEELRLTYLVPGPSWSPAYELRLFTDKKDARFTCQAIVRQQTGEDWENALLALSTSRPNESREVPELRTWRIGVADSTLGMISGSVRMEDNAPLPGVALSLAQNGMEIAHGVTSNNGRFFFDRLNPGSYDLEARLEGFNTSRISPIVVKPGQAARIDILLAMASIKEEITVAAKPGYGSIDDERRAAEAEGAEEELQEGSASYTEGVTATVFAVDSRQTVLSGDSPQKVTAAVLPVEVEKEYISVPKLDQTAYMQARFNFSGGFALAAGRCALFLDNGYASSILLPHTNSGEEVKVNVGAVPGIRVKHERLEAKKSESGLLSKTERWVREFQITLESFLKQPVAVTILDQLPVTDSKEVEIELLQAEPEPEKARASKDDPAGRVEGELRWQVKLDPREKKVIRFKFSISHPKKKPLVGVE